MQSYYNKIQSRFRHEGLRSLKRAAFRGLFFCNSPANQLLRLSV